MSEPRLIIDKLKTGETAERTAERTRAKYTGAKMNSRTLSEAKTELACIERTRIDTLDPERHEASAEILREVIRQIRGTLT